MFHENGRVENPSTKNTKFRRNNSKGPPTSPSLKSRLVGKVARADKSPSISQTAALKRSNGTDGRTDGCHNLFSLVSTVVRRTHCLLHALFRISAETKNRSYNINGVVRRGRATRRNRTITTGRRTLTRIRNDKS